MNASTDVMNRPQRNLFVVGAGLMGAGIAQVAAASGWQVGLHDPDAAALRRAAAATDHSLARFVAKGTIENADAVAIQARITAEPTLGPAADAQVVVESVFEDLTLKRYVFSQLDQLCAPGTLLASNTSAIPITQLAAATARPERVVGTHFFSPVPMMPLCELVCGEHTSEATLQQAEQFGRDLGKTTIVVRKDIAGFVTTRLLATLVMEAVRLVEAGVASAEDIDTACRLGFGHRMGPLETCDLTGADVLHAAAAVIHAQSGSNAFVVPTLLQRMVKDGDLGRKSGRGFYTY